MDFTKVKNALIENNMAVYTAKDAAARAAEEVENALLKRATGYDTDGETPKHVPPDVRAAIFYLKNRRPKSWKDKQEVAVTELPEIRLTVEESAL